jgi:hypothetical protein
VWRPISARNLHKNTQNLNIPHIGAANRWRIVGAWGKSSPSSFRNRGCHGGCSTTAGGCNRRRFVPRSSPFRSANRPSPRSATSPSSHQGSEAMSIAAVTDLEVAPPNPIVMRLAGCAVSCVARSTSRARAQALSKANAGAAIGHSPMQRARQLPAEPQKLARMELPDMASGSIFG